MPNETIKKLKEITNSDEYNLESGRLVNKLAEKWDLAEASENLSKHLVIAAFVKDLTEMIASIDETLHDMDVVDEKTMLFRFKLKADREAFDKFVSIFDGRAKQNLEIQINDLKNKADELG